MLAQEASLKKLQPQILFESAENFAGIAHSHKPQRGVADTDICLPSFPDLVNLVSLDIAQNNLSVIVAQGSISLTAKTSRTPTILADNFPYLYPNLAADLRQSTDPRINPKPGSPQKGFTKLG